MANFIADNTYIVTDSSATALSWPGGANSGVRINSVVFYALNTNAAATFLLGANTAILQFSVITQGAGTSIMPATYTVNLEGQRYQVAWIPTTLIACSAWINFA